MTSAKKNYTTWLRCLCLATCLLVPVLQVLATNYYVNDSSTDGDRWCTNIGDDANHGQSASFPKATLYDLLDDYDMGGDDTVFIDHGTYSWNGLDWTNGAFDGNDFGTGVGDEFVITGAGSSGQYITDISCANADILIEMGNSSEGYDYIKFLDMKLTGTTGYGVIFLWQPDYITIDGCHITGDGATTGGSAVHLYNDADNITISNNYLTTDAWRVIWLEQSAVANDLTVTGNVIDGSSYTAIDGIYIDQAGGSGYTITNNYIFNLQNGVNFDQDNTGCFLYNNSIYARDACLYGETQGWNIRNNIFYVTGTDANDYCIHFFNNSDSPTMDYNLFYYTGSAQVGRRNNIDYATLANWQNLFSSNDANSVNGDPGFVDPSNGNLDITSGSPAEDAGVINLVTTDIYGETRSDATNDDIGAFEILGDPNVALSSSNPAGATGGFCPSDTKHAIYEFQLTVTNAAVSLSELDFTTTNSAAADINKYQLFYSTANDLANATQVGSNITTSLGTGSHTFNGFTLNLGKTIYYFWITVDAQAGATDDNTIDVDAITTGDLTTSSGTKSGSASAGGTQTVDIPTADAGPDIDACGTALFQVNSINTAVGSYAAAGAYLSASGGGEATNATPVTDGGVASPPPQDVRNTERWGDHTYTFTGLTAGETYFVRLHFAESYFGATGSCGCGGGVGSREFDVDINGTQVLDNYDIYNDAGAEKIATVKEFYTKANASGQIIIDYTSVVDNALSRAVEIYPAVAATASGGTSYVWSDGTSAATTYFSSFATGTYTVTATNSSGCTDTDNMDVSAGCTPNIALSSNNPAKTAATLCQGATKQPIYEFQLAITNASATLNQLDFTTTNDAAADLDKYQLWYHTSDNLSAASQAGSDITASLGSGSHSFTGLGQALTTGTSYFWITADIDASATLTNTFSVSSAITTGNLSFTAGNLSGTASTGGTITIGSAVTASANGSVYADEYLCKSEGLMFTSHNDGAYDTEDFVNGSMYLSYTNGATGTASRTDAITWGSSLDPAPKTVYQLERHAEFGQAYDITSGLAPNQEYQVRLHLAETWETGNGARVMDVYINGDLVMDDIDIHAQVGHDHAYIREFVVEADDDGDIYIEFISVVGWTVAYGFEIHEFGTITASGGGTYLWSNGEVTESIQVGPQDTTYTVTVTSGGCTGTASADVVQCEVLPVELADFQAVCDDGKALITWRTYSEINNDYFDVNKSEEGWDFETFATIIGAGNSNMVNDYLAYDYAPFKGGTHYQLKQVDFDGTESKSPVFYLADDCDEDLKTRQILALYKGNDDQIHLFFKSDKREDFRLEIYSVSGALIDFRTGNTLNETTHLRLGTRYMPTGVYLFSLSIGNERLTQKILLE